MVDLDQSSGAITRHWQQVYMGPSIGWLDIPGQNVQPITTAGTYTIDPSINLIEVNVAGAVTIVLPSCQFPAAGPQAQPRLFAANPITVMDIGGNAAANNITIQPKQRHRDRDGPHLDQDQRRLWRLHPAAGVRSADLDKHLAVSRDTGGSSLSQ